MKYHENRSKSLGDMERTRNSMVNPLTLTLTCDLDHQSRELGHVLCTPSYSEKYISEVS